MDKTKLKEYGKRLLRLVSETNRFHAWNELEFITNRLIEMEKEERNKLDEYYNSPVHGKDKNL